MRSDNGGATWEVSTPVDVRIVASPGEGPSLGVSVNPLDGNDVLAALGTISRSTDAGSSFEPITISGSGEGACRTFSAVAFSPTSRGSAFAHEGLSVVRSHDSGATWSPGSDICHPFVYGVRGQSAVVVSPVNGAVYASAYGGGVQRSPDDGDHWSVLGEDLLGPVLALAVDPSDAGTIFAATEAGQVFTSANGGDTWSDLATGMAPRPAQLRAVGFDPRDLGVLYAASRDRGVLVLHRGVDSR